GLERAQSERPHDTREQAITKCCQHATSAEGTTQRHEITAECQLDSWPQRQGRHRDIVETGGTFESEPSKHEHYKEIVKQGNATEVKHEEKSDAGTDRTAKQSDDYPAQ